MSLLDDALAEVARLKEKAAACDAERARADKFEIGMRDAIRQRDEARDRVESEVAHTRDAIRQYDAAIARALKAESTNSALQDELADAVRQRDTERARAEKTSQGAGEWQTRYYDMLASRDDFARRLRHAEENLAAMTKERDAYRKAKQENDERFMIERDEARVELVAAKDDLAWRQDLYEGLSSEIHPSGKDRGYLNLLDDICALKRDRAQLRDLRATLNVLAGEGGKDGGS